MAEKTSRVRLRMGERIVRRCEGGAAIPPMFDETGRADCCLCCEWLHHSNGPANKVMFKTALMKVQS